MRPYDINGNERKFGSRRHYTFASPGYRQECARIAARLANEFGDAVDAWQIDNEFGCHGTAASYGPADAAQFGIWLERRYGSIGKLNKAWGNVFWSAERSSFANVGTPNQTVAKANPAHVLAFRRFCSEQIAFFNSAQAAAIRAKSKAPITHNFMGDFFEFDHFDVAKELDFASWDNYPLGFLQVSRTASEQHKIAYARQGDPDSQAFNCDLYRAIGRGRMWIMEQQPGPVDWAPHNPAPLPGMVRLWTLEAFAHSAEVVSYFRWRQCPFAQEQMHSGLLLPDGTEAPAFREVKQVASELSSLGRPSGDPPANVAIVIDYEAHFGWDGLPHGADFVYRSLLFDIYRALRALGIKADFVPPNGKGLQDRKLIFVPALACPSAQLTEALAKSGTLKIVGPRTGSKTSEFSIPANLPPDPLAKACGTRVTSVESLPPGLTRPLQGVGSFAKWHENVEPQENCETLIDTDQRKPALTRSGDFLYLAGWPDEPAAARIINLVAGMCGLRTIELPAGVRIRQHGGRRFIFNYTAQTALPAFGQLHQKNLQPGGVLVLP